MKQHENGARPHPSWVSTMLPGHRIRDSLTAPSVELRGQQWSV